MVCAQKYMVRVWLVGVRSTKLGCLDNATNYKEAGATN